MHSKTYSWIVLDMNNHFNTSKCSETDNKQVDILLQDMGIPRKEELELATTIHVFQPIN